MLILDENGRVVDRTDKSIDEIKREPYKHSSQEVLKEEEAEGVESFVDSLEEVDDDEEITPAKFKPDVVEVAILFAEFKARFIDVFGQEDRLRDAFLPFEDFFNEKGIDTAIDLGDLGGEGIPGEESSEQSITTSEIEGE